MRNGYKKISLDIDDRLYWEIQTMAKIKGTTSRAIILDRLQERVENFLDNYEGPLGSDTMAMLKTVYERRKEENYLSTEQKKLLQRYREGKFDD